MPGLSLITKDTVVGDTPAFLVTSYMEGLPFGILDFLACFR